MFGLNGNSRKHMLFISTLLVSVLNQSSAQFGQTFVSEPKGEHKATVLWFHGISENGQTWSAVLNMLGCNGIKFIVPTAPFRRVTGLGGTPMNAWFDIGVITPRGSVDTDGLDATLRHGVNLLSKEPPNVPVAIGGFSQGCATTLYATATYARGTYTDGSPFPANLTAAVALSGWLPGFTDLWKGKLDSPEAQVRASSLPILQAHGTNDQIVPFAVGSLSSKAQKELGFKDLVFKEHSGRGHMYYPEELKEMCRCPDWTGNVHFLPRKVWHKSGMRDGLIGLD